MDALWLDIRQTFRALFRNPGFSILAVLTMALGIGAVTGVFSAFHAVLLRSLPYPEPDRLVFGMATFKARNTGLSAHDYFDFRDQATSFESLGSIMHYTSSVASTGGDRPESLDYTYVSTNFFPTLGVAPALGRGFTVEEGRPAPVVGRGQIQHLPEVAVISHALWQRRFAGSPAAIGSTLVLRGDPVTVVGVMPAGFRFLFDADIWMPMRLNGERATLRRFHNWAVVGRLKPNMTLDKARAEMSAIATHLATTYPDSNTDMGIRLSALHDALVTRLRPQVLLISGAVAMMLLIACANVANLLLARSVTRRSEFAMRVALGASRRRLAAQLVTESSALALLGGLVGMLIAVGLQRLLPAMLGLGTGSLGISSLPLDIRVLAFAAGVSLLTGAAVGLVPALRATRVSPSEELKGASRTVTSRSGAHLRLALVAGQVSLSLVLLLGSALLIRSFDRLTRVDLGFDPENVLTARLALPATLGSEAFTSFFAGVLDELRSTPGVVAAGLVNRLPVIQGGGSTEVWAPARPEERSFSQQALGRVVFPGYIEAMRMHLVAGRDVSDADRADTPQVVVISEAVARKLYPGETAVGRQMAADFGGEQPATLDIVGVVADARLDDLEDGPSWAMYLPYRQAVSAVLQVAIRTESDPEGVTRALREIVWRRNKDVPVAEVTVLGQAIRASTHTQRTLTATVTSFSLLALLLAAIGLFGVLAYQVNQRQHEIGIRMALGAGQRHVLTTVLRQGLAVTAIGLTIGVVAGLALTRLMAGLLYEVAPTDPTSFVAAAGCLIVVALAACLAPALRALAVQPVRALRYE